MFIPQAFQYVTRFARIIRNSKPYFYTASGWLARIIRISDSRGSPDSRESCKSIRVNHATKCEYRRAKLQVATLGPTLNPTLERKMPGTAPQNRVVLFQDSWPCPRTLMLHKNVAWAWAEFPKDFGSHWTKLLHV